ncbi:MAG: MATE family efflux transporter [Gemmatimonadetes bacterium]|nr:MATE family efflux transporter [Gemmatimonadota bacterium]
MRDLVKGSVAGHLWHLAVPLAAGMVFQTLYHLIDLYFVAQLGDAAIAGVAAAGNIQFIVTGLTQVLAVGTMALIAQAVGRRDLADANLVFNQGLGMAAVAAAVTVLGGLSLGGWYLERLGANPDTVVAGKRYLVAYLPALGGQFAMVTIAAALRGTGIVRPAMTVQIATVVLNAALAPILIAGWGTGRPLGTLGAGLATSIAVLAGVAILWAVFARLEHAVRIDRAHWRPRWEVWRRVLQIGLPTGAEFGLLFVTVAISMYLIRDFGAAAQAGYGLGSRILQAIFLPAMAVAFAAAPLAGQNVGAGRFDRVAETFRVAALGGSAIMVCLTALAQWQPAWFFHWFTKEAAVVAVGTEFLRYVSYNFVAQGLTFTCSGMFQAFGNTIPALQSSVGRVALYAGAAGALSRWPGFQLRHLWLVSVATVAAQAGLSLLLLRREYRRQVSG